VLAISNLQLDERRAMLTIETPESTITYSWPPITLGALATSGALGGSIEVAATSHRCETAPVSSI
jgi:hypothetical protein